MSQSAVEPTGSEQGEREATQPETPASTGNTGTQGETPQGGTATSSEPETGEGKGSKEAILANLATERDRRQAAETQMRELTAAIQRILGGEQAETAQTPQEIAEALATSETRANEAQLQLAIYRSDAGKTADVDALLDSKAFLHTMQEIDSTDAAAINHAIEEFVASNPRFQVKASGPNPATRDLRNGNTPAPAALSMDQLIRGS